MNCIFIHIPAPLVGAAESVIVLEVLWSSAERPVRVGLLSRAWEIENLISLFEAVAEEKGWNPDGELRETALRSTYLALEVSGRIAGGLQIVSADRIGRFPCHDVWPEAPKSITGRTAHVAIMAIERQARGGARLFWHLAAEMWRYCVGAGVSSVYVETSPRILPIYRRLGWPLEVVGELRPQWGAPTYLCSLGIPEVAEAILRRAEHSAYYRQVVSQAFRVDVAPERTCDVAVRNSGVTTCIAG